MSDCAKIIADCEDHYTNIDKVCSKFSVGLVDECSKA
jgi:hypothetical protein